MLTWDNFRTEREERGKPFVVAHRGAHGHEPENTLAAFARALDQGVDALETDLRFTRDDQIVLIHDARVDRTTNGQGAVNDFSLAALKRLRTRRGDGNGEAEDGTGRLTEERVPSLIDLLAMTQARTPLLLELKDRRFAQRRYAEQLVETLALYGILESCAIVSFQMDLVRAVNAVYPDIPTGYITMWNPLPPTEIRLLGPLWPILYLNPAYVAWAHAMDAIVAPLDPNPLPRLDYYLKLGVDALLADDPAPLIAALE